MLVCIVFFNDVFSAVDVQVFVDMLVCIVFFNVVFSAVEVQVFVDYVGVYSVFLMLCFLLLTYRYLLTCWCV